MANSLRSSLALLLAAVLLLAGCNGSRREESTPHKTESSNASQLVPEPEPPPVAADLLEIADPGSFTLYRAARSADNELFFLPLPREVAAPLDAAALSALSASTSDYTSPLDFAMTVEEDLVTIDLRRPAEEVYRSWEEQLLTLWATVTRNSGKGVRLLMEGAPYRPMEDSLALPLELPIDSEGFIQDHEIKLPEHSMEELAALRRSLPYQIPDPPDYMPEDNMDYPILDHAQAVWLANTIYRVTLFNLPEHSFSDISQAPDKFISMAGYFNSPSFSWYQQDDWYPQLLPLTSTCADYEGVMREHVEQTAAQLFGDDVTFAHTAASPWRYDEYGGVYTPPHMGFMGFRMPVVLDYREFDNRYEVTVVFITYYAGMDYMDEEGELISREEAIALCQESLPRHTITLVKAKTDRLLYRAHLLPEDETIA